MENCLACADPTDLFLLYHSSSINANNADVSLSQALFKLLTYDAYLFPNAISNVFDTGIFGCSMQPYNIMQNKIVMKYFNWIVFYYRN